MNLHADQIEQVDLDLAEIAAQADSGELDPATAERLRAIYELERATLVSADEMAPEKVAAPSSRRTRIGAAVLGISMLGVAIFAVASLQDDPPSEALTEGAPTAALEGGVDLASVSTEEMEAVVAANPSIIGMRLALAGRYVDAGDHSSALDHYLVVLDQDPDQPEALAMIGWLTYLAGESELAEPFVIKALATEPDYPLALWFLANIKLDTGDRDGAIAAINRLLDYDLAPEVRAEAERFLAEVQP